MDHYTATSLWWYLHSSALSGQDANNFHCHIILDLLTHMNSCLSVTCFDHLDALAPQTQHSQNQSSLFPPPQTCAVLLSLISSLFSVIYEHIPSLLKLQLHVFLDSPLSLSFSVQSVTLRKLASGPSLSHRLLLLGGSVPSGKCREM